MIFMLVVLLVGCEVIWFEVNWWICSGGGFDGVVDFDVVLCDLVCLSVL